MASVQQAASNVLNWLRMPAAASLAFTAAGVAGLYFKQTELIYPRNFPAGSRTDVPTPSMFGVSYWEDVNLRTSDGESLHGYFIPPANNQIARPVTVLMFHGNAGNIGHRVPIARVLSEIGLNVLMLEYRGYGRSTGKPDEKGLMIDAQTGLDHIRQRPETMDTKIVVYGQSLGGAVAIYLVKQNKDTGDIAGLILENTFTSLRDLIPSVAPPARYVTFLCHQLWPSIDAIPAIRDIPILFLSGLQDEIVPPSHMKALYDASRATRKVWKDFPNGQHNETIAEPGYFQAIADFITSHVL